MTFSEHYLDLITSQHRDKEKFISVLTVLLDSSTDIFELAVILDEFFDLDNAEGEQEDFLGHIVGASRLLPFTPKKGLSPILDNQDFRVLIKACIARNIWKGGIEDLRELWRTLYGEYIVIIDNQDMTIDVVVIGGQFSDLAQQMILHGMIVPKPQSVGINYYFANGAIFSYDKDTDTLKGYDEGYWIYQYDEDMLFAYDADGEEDEMLIGYDQGWFK